MGSSSYMCDNMFQTEMTDSNNSNSIYDEVASEINNVLKTSLKPILDTMEQKSDSYTAMVRVMRQMPEYQSVLAENAELKLRIKHMSSHSDHKDPIQLHIDDSTDTESAIMIPATPPPSIISINDESNLTISENNSEISLQDSISLEASNLEDQQDECVDNESVENNDSVENNETDNEDLKAKLDLSAEAKKLNAKVDA